MAVRSRGHLTPETGHNKSLDMAEAEGQVNMREMNSMFPVAFDVYCCFINYHLVLSGANVSRSLRETGLASMKKGECQCVSEGETIIRVVQVLMYW